MADDEESVSWVLLHGSDAALSSRAAGPYPPRSRIVLLHGWLQSHRCWLATAYALRDLYHHDVLLLDFYAHGLTSGPSNKERMSPFGFVELLCRRLAAIGWDGGARLTLCGCSFGAGVAMRYACANPSRVARLTLVVPPGLEEPWYMPCHFTRELAKVLCALAPHSRWLDLLRMIRTTPIYGIDMPRLVALAAAGTFNVFVYGAELDVVHAPHSEFWRAAEHRCNGFLRYELLKGRTHWGCCDNLYHLGLHNDEALWHDPRAREPRARL